MQLVDAIEAWGRAHRSTFEDGEAEALAEAQAAADAAAMEAEAADDAG